MEYDIEVLRKEVINKKKNKSSIVTNILKTNTFREACVIAKSFLTTQSYGHVIDTWFSEHYDFKKLKSSDGVGDDKVFGKYNTEVKASLCDDGKKYNYVQIRLTHDIHFYLLPTYDFVLDKTYYFLLTKKEMVEMVTKYGEYAHGRKKEKGPIVENLDNPDIEFCIRPVVGKECWKEIMKFNVNEDDFRNEKFWANKLKN